MTAILVQMCWTGGSAAFSQSDAKGRISAKMYW